MRQLQAGQARADRRSSKPPESSLEVAHIGGRRRRPTRRRVGRWRSHRFRVGRRLRSRRTHRRCPPVDLLPAVAEATTAPTASLQPTPEVTPQPTSGPPTIGDVFGVSARSSGDAQYITILDEPEPGHLVGRLRLPLPVATVDGIFAFQQFSSASAPGRPVPIADWPISVRFARGRQPSLHGRKRNAPGSANHSRRAEAGRARLPPHGRRHDESSDQGELDDQHQYTAPTASCRAIDGVAGMGGRIAAPQATGRPHPGALQLLPLGRGRDGRSPATRHGRGRLLAPQCPQQPERN